MADKVTKFLAYNGKISVSCCNTTELVEKSRETHDLSPVATAAFGRLLSMAVLIAADIKNKDDKLTLQVKGNGPLGMMMVTANKELNLKGYVVNPYVDIPLNEDGKLNVGNAVGHEGYINVIKDIGLKDQYVGICPLVSGEIAEDFANYYVNSEQKQSAVALGVLVDKNGVKSSGGYLIQPMPDATEEEISKVEQSIFSAGAISKMLDKNMTLEEIAKKITGDENVIVIHTDIHPIYKCDCSKEHMSDALVAIGKEELKEIIATDEHAEIVCHFCNKKYHFSKQELIDIMKKI